MGLRFFVHEPYRWLLAQSSAHVAHAGDRHGSDAFLAADEAQSLVGGSLHPHLIRLDVESRCDPLSHLWNMLHDFRGLGDERRVHVLNGEASIGGDLCTLFKDFKAGDSLNTGIAWRKPVANVRLAHGTEHRIGDGMGEDIRITVAFQAVCMRNGHAAQHQITTFLEGVDIITYSYACHRGLGMLRVVIGGFFQAGEDITDLQVNALTLLEVADMFVSGLG